MTDDFATRVAGIGALAEPVRRELYLYVVAQSEPVGRDQVAAETGVPRHAVKFHLDRLVSEGLLETSSGGCPASGGRARVGPRSCTAGPAARCR